MVKRVAQYSLNNASRIGVRTIPMQLRNYSKYRLMGLEGFEFPESKEDAVAKIQKQLQIAKEGGFLRPNHNVLNIIASHEFSFNGTKNLFGYMVYNAANPIPLEYYKSAVEASQEFLKKLPEGIVFFPGTAAIDTGEKTSEGKGIYENRGCGITSGSQSKVFEFSKQSISHLDKWNRAAAIKKGTDPLVIEIKDRSGDGRSIWMACSICLDYIDHVENFAKPPDILFVPACGWPRKVPPIDSDIIVMDAIQNPSRLDIPFHYSGVHKLRKIKFDPSLTAQLVFSIASGETPSPKFISELAKVMKNWNYFKKEDEITRILKMENYDFEVKSKRGILTTEEIPLNHIYDKYGPKDVAKDVAKNVAKDFSNV